MLVTSYKRVRDEKTNAQMRLHSRVQIVSGCRDLVKSVLGVRMYSFSNCSATKGQSSHQTLLYNFLHVATLFPRHIKTSS